MQILRYIAISCVSGITAIIPGVSGGTIFAIFGLSEDLAKDINDLTEALFKYVPRQLGEFYKAIIKHGQLPIIIGLGSLLSSLFYAKVLVSFGEPLEIFLRFLFLGLVVFSLPSLWKETSSDNPRESYAKYIYLAIGFFGAILIFKQDSSLVETTHVDYNSAGYLLHFFLISLIAGITGILPGISGTNIFILGGLFEDYILFSSNIGDYPVQYALFILASIIGSIIAAKCITLLFKHFRVRFFSLMTGLTASTLFVIWTNPFTSIMSFIQTIIGFTCAYLLIKMLNNKQQ